MRLSSKELPKSVRDFIRTYLDSAEQLEILCLLRLRSEREWTAPALAKELRTNVSSTGKRLDNLLKNGFLTQRTTGSEKFYQYTATGSLKTRTDEFFQYYPTYRLRVYEAIFSPGVASAKAFSESFKLRPGDDDK